MRKYGYYALVILAIHTFFSNQALSQEEEIIAKAENLFEAKSYQEAMPLFAQLVSVHPENGEYNYKFGVCTLFGNRTDRRRPIRYLNNALKTMGDNPELNYHLGIAYYQNEEFANAMKFLNLYLATLDPNSPLRPQILEKVNCCLNGLTLEHANLIGEIFSTSEFQKDNFHRAYRADEFNGTLILKPDIFVSPAEKGQNQNSFVYISEPRGTLYFSGYEGNSAKQRDIFKVTMTEEGEWGKPEKISDVVNSNFDEAYPVLTDYGTTLYFCSKGHNSIGGYDIFRTKLDKETQTFSKPENLGVGINSPFDDILFIPDATGEGAFFASNRDNLEEGINVFRIRLIDNAFGKDQILATTGFESKLNIGGGDNNPDNSGNSTQLNNQEKEPIAYVAKTEQKPSEKAANLLKERTIANNMADTAYMKVAETKSLVRALTNKRDRANAISQRKEEEAKNLEISFEQVIAKLGEFSNEPDFEKELQKAIELKNNIFQIRFRAEKANHIAWNIGKQIKIKNTELEELKKKAGEVQSASVKGEFTLTTENYAALMEAYQKADTLTEYNDFIVSLAKDELDVDMPGSELAFADEYREAFKNNTLLAATQKQKPEVEKIPIRVVDNRTSVASNTIEAVKQVEPVQFSDYTLPEDNEELAIYFFVDAVEAIKQVEEIHFASNRSDLIMDDQLEINFKVDGVTPIRLVEEINHTELANNIPLEDEQLELNFFVDRIEATQLVTPVAFEEIAFLSGMENEEVEINFKNDGIEAWPVVSMVEFTDLAAHITIDETELELNTSIDKTNALDLVSEVTFKKDQYAIAVDDIPSIDFTIDGIEAIPIVEQIVFNDLSDVLETGMEDIEINMEMDRIQPINLIAQVNFKEKDFVSEIDDIPVIDFNIDGIEAKPMVEQIAYNENINLIEIMEEEVVINFDHDMKVIPLVQAVNIAFNSLAEIDFDDNLELSFSNDMVIANRLVQPIRIEEYALNMEEEDLEVNFENNMEQAVKLVEPVLANNSPQENMIMINDVLEIKIKNEVNQKTDAIALTAPVPFNDIDISLAIDEEPEINFSIDKIQEVEVFALVQPVPYNESTFMAFEPSEDDITINFMADVPSEDNLFAENTQGELSTSNISQLPNITPELYYLREAISIATDIETSYNDFEMLNKALTNPGDLSYEELLFSASLAQDPEEKLNIYNQAFVHINRDWRAFNNAAVTALSLKDLDHAEVLLYQASLISSDNGKIENNMGILSCYYNKLDEAEKHFKSAVELGVNSEYNLLIVRNLKGSKMEPTPQLKNEMGESHYYEVLGDVIDYGTNE
ncbi:MAG: hypothetical protein K9G76_11630 [Bacteroidales bacterium]|nr:hypothetical protein [Bacteroidales bacterium]MCF8405101.1 hypothetical protein [Bacteroidales bacterium]